MTHSGGSLHRWFPGGKAQLVSEALDVAGKELSAQFDSKLLKAGTLSDAVDAVIAPWRQRLLESDFTLGCLIVATVVDASANDQLREKSSALLAHWHDSVRGSSGLAALAQPNQERLRNSCEQSSTV